MVDETLDNKEKNTCQHKSRDDRSPQGIERILHFSSIWINDSVNVAELSGESSTTMWDHANQHPSRIVVFKLSCQFTRMSGNATLRGIGSPSLRRSGEIGRRKGLKIPRPKGHTGSIPVSGTNAFPDNPRKFDLFLYIPSSQLRLSRHPSPFSLRIL